MDQTESLIGSILFKLQMIFAGVLLVVVAIGGLYMLTLLVSATNQKQSSTGSSFLSENPNVVSGFANKAATSTGHFFDSLGNAIGNSAAAVGSVAASTGRVTGHIFNSTIHGIGRGVIYMVKLPGIIVGSAYQSFTNTAPVSAIIKPAEHKPVPLIDPNSPELAAAKKALPSNPSISTNKPQWPMRGLVTTEYGVPGPLYNPVHTGIDISDSNPIGVTPILPFRTGVVIDTVHSSNHLGNHVMIDHGDGITSVYGHLSSISVKVGQRVSKSTTLGYQGSTGVSTGPHLHFEIRVNGKVTNPRNFILGQP